MPKPKKSNAELYEEAEAELYGEAIKQTEREVFDDALGLAPDENDGDTSLEQMDDDDAPTGDEEPTDEEEGDEPDESEEGEGEEGEGGEPESPDQVRGGDRQPEHGEDRRGVPPSRLREEADARRVAEAETRELRARLENLERNQRQPQKPQQQPEKPDMFADPEGWAQAQPAEIEANFAARHVNASLNDTAEEHGERFHEAYQA